MSKNHIAISDSSKDDLWENDPYLTSNVQRSAKVKKEAFQTLQSLDIKPEQVKDAAVRKAYKIFLEQGVTPS